MTRRNGARGAHLFANYVMCSASALFHEIVDYEDGLAAILNGGLEVQSAPFRLVRIS